MKKTKTIGFLIACAMVFNSLAFANNDEASKIAAQEAYGKLPLYFIQNDGQLDKKVKFYEKYSGPLGQDKKTSCI